MIGTMVDQDFTKVAQLSKYLWNTSKFTIGQNNEVPNPKLSKSFPPVETIIVGKWKVESSPVITTKGALLNNAAIRYDGKLR